MKNNFRKLRITFDTCPLMKLFSEEDGWQSVEKILTYVEKGEVEGAICVVTLTEIHSKYIKEGRPDLGKSRIQELNYAVYLKKLEINEEVAAKAGEFKGKYSIPLADALIAASSYYDSSIVVSDDVHFRKIREIRTMTEKELLTQLT